jgi:DNA anti-recombination protein RmuC
MKSIAFGWQQITISKNAKRILGEGVELYQRLAKWLDHYRATGSRIESLVETFNKSVCSLQTRLIPSVRRFQDLSGISQELDELACVDAGVHLPPATADVASEAGLTDCPATQTEQVTDLAPAELLRVDIEPAS